jgi:YD repeat-containing protein
MFLHLWVSVRLMVASVIKVVRSRRMRWRRRYDEMGRRMRQRMTMGRRVKFGRTRVGEEDDDNIDQPAWQEGDALDCPDGAW